MGCNIKRQFGTGYRAKLKMREGAELAIGPPVPGKGAAVTLRYNDA
jgi:hypothetical protein